MGRAGLLLLGLLAVSVVHAGVDLVTREVLGRACKRYIDKDPLLPCDSTFSDKASELKIQSAHCLLPCAALQALSLHVVYLDS